MEESLIQFFESDQFRIHTRLDKNGNAWLNIEDSARGLGFVEKEKISTSGERYIRWERVNAYIAEIKSRAKSELIQMVTLPVKKGDYIPENLFYRLAMKANNAAAEKFMAWVADEVIPALRKYGYYISPNADVVSSAASAIPVEKKLEMLLEFAKLTTPGDLRNQFLNEAALLLTGKKF